MKSSKDTAWANTEATVNSLAANLSKANTVGSIVKRVISREYAIEEKDGFPRYNLTNFYNNTTLQGQGAVAQLTSVYVGFLKNVCENTILKCVIAPFYSCSSHHSRFGCSPTARRLPTTLISTLWNTQHQLSTQFLVENWMVFLIKTIIFSSVFNGSSRCLSP